MCGNRNTELCYVKWKLAQEGWFTLNTDGSAKGNPRLTGAGGLVRDQNGRWLNGFCIELGFTPNIVAELWGLIEGLKLATRMQISHLQIELNAKVFIDMLLNEESNNRLLNPLIMQCRNLMIPHSSIKQIYWEANRCADCRLFG